MSFKKFILFSIAAGFALGGLGCNVPESRTASGVISTDEPRIWVIRESHSKNQVIAEVFRCADGADPTQPPKPVCVKAPMVEQ